MDIEKRSGAAPLFVVTGNRSVVLLLSSKAVYLVEFGGPQVENLAPAVDANQGTYSFGTGSAQTGAPQNVFNFGGPMA